MNSSFAQVKKVLEKIVGILSNYFPNYKKAL